MERHQEEKIQKEREWYQGQLASALSELSDLEMAYLSRHGEEIESLKSQKLILEEKLHALEKDYKTHLERVEARRNRIQETEDELEETYELLTQTRQRDDRDRIEVLRLLEDIEQAIVRQQDRLKSQKAELLGYELDQKCIVENRERLTAAYAKNNAKMSALEEPLEKVTRERLRLEAKRMEVAGSLGTVDAPYQLPNESELPYLVAKMKEILPFGDNHISQGESSPPLMQESEIVAPA
jgi:chromosome segregation ATPase